MSYRGVSNWPPVWTQTRSDDVKTMSGEVGTLIYVHSNPLMPRKCFLVMEHDEQTYVGTLIFDNDAFCRQIDILLQGHLKRSIRDIGDLDLSATL